MDMAGSRNELETHLKETKNRPERMLYKAKDLFWVSFRRVFAMRKSVFVFFQVSFSFVSARLQVCFR